MFACTFTWAKWGSHGVPWSPMGSHGVPWGPMGSHGAPMASMENPRISEIVDFNENHYSVRQKIGEPGSKSIRNIIPVHSVTSKRPESPYGPLLDNFCRKSSFSVFRPIGPLLEPYYSGDLKPNRSSKKQIPSASFCTAGTVCKAQATKIALFI